MEMTDWLAESLGTTGDDCLTSPMKTIIYRFSKISSEIPKVGISGCKKNGRFTERFFDSRYMSS
jgi:hypothetical protein